MNICLKCSIKSNFTQSSIIQSKYQARYINQLLTKIILGLKSGEIKSQTLDRSKARHYPWSPSNSMQPNTRQSSCNTSPDLQISSLDVQQHQTQTTILSNKFNGCSAERDRYRQTSVTWIEYSVLYRDGYDNISDFGQPSLYISPHHFSKMIWHRSLKAIFVCPTSLRWRQMNVM